MGFRLAAEASQPFVAFALVAGGEQPVESQDPVRPMLYLVGTRDPLLPLAGGNVKLP